MIILGIDPGTASTGYGLIEVNGKEDIGVIDYGVIKTSKETGSGERLREIYNELNLRIIKIYKPEVFVIEKLFFATNAKTAIRVGQAQGAMLMAAAVNRLEVFEYSPMTIKKVLTGNGRADKGVVQRYVRKHLGAGVRKKKGEKTHFDNAADALAVAICHVMQTREKDGREGESKEVMRNG